MALLNEKDNYIRMIVDDFDNNFEIYASEKDRVNYKNATPSKKIINKYNSIINSYKVKIEKFVKNNNLGDVLNINLYKLSEKYPKLADLLTSIDKVVMELYYYNIDLNAEKGAQHEYPIMETYYADVKNSIPNIIERGYTMLRSNNIQTMYLEAKKAQRFGETKDC